MYRRVSGRRFLSSLQRSASTVPALLHAHQSATSDLPWHLIAIFAAGSVAYCSSKDEVQEKERERIFSTEYDAIIVGGGTAGCITAYLLAKWKKEHNLPGRVLLIERGPAYDSVGPDPKMPGWFTNWGTFGEAHDSIREDGSPYPVIGTDHKGMGGCGTHDTRITFIPRQEQRQRLAKLMGWTPDYLDRCMQAALNMMPLSRAIQTPEPFYDAVIRTLTSDGDLQRVPNDEFAAHITVDSIAEVSIAMYQNENRWTSAYLVSDAVKPSNLDVLSDVTVNKISMRHRHTPGAARAETLATGVDIIDKNNTHRIKLSLGGEVAVTAGALGTPGLLLRSGIGSREHLSQVGIPCIVDNEEVGHGVDHPEIAVMYEWNSDRVPILPRGGAMGWPLVLFMSLPELANTNNFYSQAHFGAGSAEPYTSMDAVVCTPSCVAPDPSHGYHVQLKSKNPFDSMRIVHAEQPDDMTAMAHGVLRTVKLMDKLQAAGLAKQRIQPSMEVDLSDIDSIRAWVRDNHWTVFHFMSSCKASLTSPVADERFRVRAYPTIAPSEVITNLRVGSGACLPEIPESNPHLTISAFSVALAQDMLKTECVRRNVQYHEPFELKRSADNLKSNEGNFCIRRSGEEVPALGTVVKSHVEEWTAKNETN